MATFGNLTDGVSTNVSSVDRKAASPFVATGNGIIQSLTVRVWLDSAGSTVAKGFIYSDNAGSPDVLLAVTDEFTISNTSEQALTANFSGLQQKLIGAGQTYWIGIIWQDPGVMNVVRSQSSVANQQASLAETYSGGPSSTWGVVSLITGPLDIYVTYNQSGTTTSTSSISSTSSSISTTSSSTSSTSTSASTTSKSTSSTSSSISTSSTSSSISSTSSSISSTSSSSTSASTSISSTSSSISSTSFSSTSLSTTSISSSISSTSSSFSSTSSSISSTSSSISSTSFSSTSSSSSTSTTTIAANLIYSYEDKISIPSTNANLANSMTAINAGDVTVDDDDYFVQFGSEYIIQEFKYKHVNNTDNIQLTWRGRSTISTSVSPILMQIYDNNAFSWVTVASETRVAADVDFQLQVTIKTNLSNYYDTNQIIVARVVQQVF